MIKRHHILSLSCIALMTTLCGCANDEQFHYKPGEYNKKQEAQKRSQVEYYDPDTDRSLSSLEHSYVNNPKSEEAAVHYAAGLRQKQYYNRASLVLSPFIQTDKPGINALTEYAAIQMALSHYVEAENYAQKSTSLDPYNYMGYRNLGLALEAQGQHEAAEKSLRKAVELWQGGPVRVMNDLALNLAGQNNLYEAATMLKKALEHDPDDIETQRNLRIILALQQTKNHTPPKPKEKPEKKSETKEN